ncbi:MAG: hypothetical protein H0U74_14340 [Bradymonadaceae bacterium]|nr:hypothetical protein [Lujinxingiaceae bacterium]
MKNSLANPMVFITHVQPFLVVWVLTISFFVALAAAAVLSRGRRWYEICCIFLLLFVVAGSLGLVGTNSFLDVRVFEVEVISYRSVD